MPFKSNYSLALFWPARKHKCLSIFIYYCIYVRGVEIKSEIKIHSHEIYSHFYLPRASHIKEEKSNTKYVCVCGWVLSCIYKYNSNILAHIPNRGGCDHIEPHHTHIFKEQFKDVREYI